jgi:hypothetical protein
MLLMRTSDPQRIPNLTELKMNGSNIPSFRDMGVTCASSLKWQRIMCVLNDCFKKSSISML